MSELSRRDFMKGAVVGTAAISAAGLFAGCAPKSSASSSSSTGSSSSATTSTASYVLDPKTMPDASTGHNFDVAPESKTTVDTTLENLKSAIVGETAATTKYATWAQAAEKEGFPELKRLFSCTSDAEKIHIELEYALASKLDPSYQKPAIPEVPTYTSGTNLIEAANGEIYETSDMYPSFIKAAQAEGNSEAVQIFTRAKLAEAYHVERYLNAYSMIDTPSDETYYLCPVCGYIHKGEDFTACPICLTPKASFKAY